MAKQHIGELYTRKECVRKCDFMDMITPQHIAYSGNGTSIKNKINSTSIPNVYTNIKSVNLKYLMNCLMFSELLFYGYLRCFRHLAFGQSKLSNKTETNDLTIYDAILYELCKRIMQNILLYRIHHVNGNFKHFVFNESTCGRMMGGIV